MSDRLLRITLVFAFLCTGGFALSAKQDAAPDLVLFNGTIYTLDEANTRVSAVAIRDGIITAVGSDEELGHLIENARNAVDLAGKTVVPGFTDAHAHILGLGKSMEQLKLVGTSSFEQIVDMVREETARRPEGEWILGRGWDQNDWEIKRFPAHHQLSDVSPRHPVYLRRVDGHAAIVNVAALTLAGIDRSTVDPDGGRIIRDDAGEPTGVLIDDAIDLVSDLVPELSVEQKKRAILLAQDSCLACGITGVHDAGMDWETARVFEELADEGKLKIRVYGMIYGPGEDIERLIRDGARSHPSGKFTIRAIKMLMDGALGSRGAALLEDYDDEPGNRGLLTADQAELTEITKRALANNLQVCVHAIGDRANRAVLDAFEAALKAVPHGDHRLRIEHAQILAPNDIPRFASLGVIASMQPTHCTSDMYWADDRLGDTRLQGAYAWRTLLNSGASMCFGSDFPVEGASVIDGLYAATTRQDKAGWPEGGWHPEEKLTILQSLKAFTVGAAYARFAEEALGTIEVGKAADFVLLSDNITEIPAAGLLSVQVEETIIAGESVFRCGASEKP